MPPKLLHILATLLSVCTVLGGLDLSGVIKIFPPDVAGWFAIAPSVFMGLCHLILTIGDQADDGIKNGSFPGSLKLHPGTILAAFLIPACASLISANAAVICLGLLGIILFVPSVLFVPRRVRNCMIGSALILICCLSLATSCTVTTSPDGTQTKQVDPAAVSQSAGLLTNLLTALGYGPAPVATPVQSSK